MKNNTQNVNQLTIIANLRAENYSYASIAKQLGMSPNTVKSICLRKGILTPDKPRKTKTEKAALQICKQCGKPIDNSWNRIGKSFCSDSFSNCLSKSLCISSLCVIPDCNLHLDIPPTIFKFCLFIYRFSSYNNITMRKGNSQDPAGNPQIRTLLG